MIDYLNEIKSRLLPLPEEFCQAELVFESMKEEDIKLGNEIYHFINFVFRNPNSKAVLDISFGTAPNHPVFTGKIDSISETTCGSFFIQDYFLEKDRTEEFKNIKKKKFDEDDLQYIHRIIDWLKKMVATEFKPFLTGEAREAIHRDYSFMGM